MEWCITNIDYGTLDVVHDNTVPLITHLLDHITGEQSFHAVHVVRNHVEEAEGKTCLH